MPQNNSPLYKEWLTKAENDLKTAQILIEENGPPDTLCFHCQQAVEKYLKGFLVFNRKKFPKTHDLIFLMNLCIKLDKDFQQFGDDLIILNKYYIESRYPPEIRDYSFEESKKALTIAENLVKFTNNKIK